MRHLALALALAMLPAGVAFAKDAHPAAVVGATLTDYAAAELAGKWNAEDGSSVTIRVKNDSVSVARSAGPRGQKQVLRSQGVRNGHFTFSYFVPATGYTVTIEVTSVDGDSAEDEWSNDHDDSGSEALSKGPVVHEYDESDAR